MPRPKVRAFSHLLNDITGNWLDCQHESLAVMQYLLKHGSGVLAVEGENVAMSPARGGQQIGDPSGTDPAACLPGGAMAGDNMCGVAVQYYTRHLGNL